MILHMKKTNAARLLDTLEISYELLTYAIDRHHLDAETIAAKVSLPPAQVFKTLIAQGNLHGPCFAVIPGDQDLDLKALARYSHNRKVNPVPLKDVQSLTGYIRGGVTALASKKTYPVYLDQLAMTFEKITVSAGMRGCLILLSPQDYIAATGAKIGILTRMNPMNT
jgi:Cys-tRNA(Pro)/Cys-tRNA(Cys) deacylase